MNLHDIPTAAPMFAALWPLVAWPHPIIHLAGLGIAAWAFVRCRKWGYLVVSLYFAYILYSTFGIPFTKRATTADDELQEKVGRAINEAAQRVYLEEGRQPAPTHPTFPVGQLVLVIGLWLVARREPQVDQAPK